VPERRRASSVSIFPVCVAAEWGLGKISPSFLRYSLAVFPYSLAVCLFTLLSGDSLGWDPSFRAS